MIRRVLLTAVGVVVTGALTIGSASACPDPPSPATTLVPATGAGTSLQTPSQPVNTRVRTPSAADAAAIARAVRTSPLTGEVPPDAYEVTGTVLAASDPSWAWAELRPRVADVDRVEGVLRHSAKGWSLVQLGSYEVGCGVAPPTVLDDFDLTCPPAGT